MAFLRKYWYDLGAVISVIIAAFLIFNYQNLTSYQLLMWLNLISLFLHQSEEYRIAGTFPGMVNTVLYKSKMPGRFPLNTNTAFFINVLIGWTSYLLAAILSEGAIWLGIATMIISLGNIIAHTFIFNYKGKTIYNAGLATSWLLFVPCIYFFILLISKHHLATSADYLIGITLGVLLNVIGILKMIDWMADKNTKHVFEQRNLLPVKRKNNIT